MDVKKLDEKKLVALSIIVYLSFKALLGLACIGFGLYMLYGFFDYTSLYFFDMYNRKDISAGLLTLIGCFIIAGVIIFSSGDNKLEEVARKLLGIEKSSDKLSKESENR
jgi:TRAP-type C4-dicarboxylate transport system permease small subunit